MCFLPPASAPTAEATDSALRTQLKNSYSLKRWYVSRAHCLLYGNHPPSPLKRLLNANNAARSVAHLKLSEHADASESLRRDNVLRTINSPGVIHVLCIAMRVYMYAVMSDVLVHTDSWSLGCWLVGWLVRYSRQLQFLIQMSCGVEALCLCPAAYRCGCLRRPIFNGKCGIQMTLNAIKIVRLHKQCSCGADKYLCATKTLGAGM